MAEPSKTSRLREAPAAKGPPRIAPRRKTFDQRLRIQERLTMGLTVAHIARVEQLTVRRVRQIIAEMLASREIDPPAGFVQFQIARLSEAMIVARTMMMQGNLQAMDRFIRLTSELDRYHGFGPAQISRGPEAAPPPRLAAPEPCAISPGPVRIELEGKFFASQPVEIAQDREGISEAAPPPISPPCSYGEGSGVGLFAPVDETLVSGSGKRSTPCPSPRERGGEIDDEVEGKFSASQSIEIARNREGIWPTPPRRAVPLDVAEFDPW